MNISLNIILDRLSKYNIEPHLALPSDKSFDSVVLLPMSPTSTLDSRKLYFCRLSLAMLLPYRLRENATMLCLRDRIKDDTETDDMMQGIVIINENISYEQVFSSVQEVFCELTQWYLTAQEALIQNRPLQDLVDLSETILGNYVQITDSSFNLLAYTRNTECDEEITIQARKLGYHPESTIKQFAKYHRTELWEKTTGLLINNDCDMCKYPLISKIFKYSNTYFAHAVMTCNHHPATKGMTELFELFTELLAVHVEKEWESTNNCHHTYDAFLIDLYEGRVTRRDIAEERSRHVGIPLDGGYCLTLSSHDEGGRVALSNVIQDITALRPKDRVTNFHGRIAVLSQLPERDFMEHFTQLQNDMASVMEKYDLRCGMSAIFNDLLEAPNAVVQAEHALSYSGRTPGTAALPVFPNALNGLQHRAVSFEESFFYILLGHSPENKTIWRGSVYYAALKKLHDYDQQHNVNNLSLLYVYLICESRPTDTANALFMSRNNVVYRIDRIQEMLNMDLKSASVRFKLMTSYVMMQLYGLD